MDASAWSAIGTTLAAVAAIFAVLQTKISLERQRSHDYKSVLPIPQVIFGDYINQLYVKLENAGVGPIILLEVLVRDIENKSTKRSIIDLMPPTLSHIVWSNFVGKIEGRAVPAQASLTLISFEGEADDFDRVRAALGNLTITVNFTDVYGNTFPSYSRDFDWFNRPLSETKSHPAG